MSRWRTKAGRWRPQGQRFRQATGADGGCRSSLTPTGTAEWYEPYQTFRLRLVGLLDELLALLERDPSYTRFLLDGQMAVIDDYLEVRPENEARIRALAASGRLSMGPWYILMDEFLVSGETIVRDLQMGLLRATAFGGAMNVGYLPDMFGHIAQMPQILRDAGFEHAVVWRGVPSSVDRSAFWWEAPDGSTVRAEYLVTGYGNGASIPDDAKALVRRITDHEAEVGAFLVGGLLFMNGTDHQEPQPWLGRVVAEANQIQDDYELSVSTLAEHLDAEPTDGLPSWKGELRSGARANVLMGVASNRVDVKRAAAIAERALERRAEPLWALFQPAESWPGSAAGRWRGARWCATPRTTPPARARWTRSSTPCWFATPRPIASPTASPTRRCAPSRARWPSPGPRS